MNDSTLEHPSEEALERFLLHHVQGEELIWLEGHLLSCETCLVRLEAIGIDVAATKLALKRLCCLERNCFPERRGADQRRFK